MRSSIWKFHLAFTASVLHLHWILFAVDISNKVTLDGQGSSVCMKSEVMCVCLFVCLCFSPNHILCLKFTNFKGQGRCYVHGLKALSVESSPQVMT